MLEVIKSLLDNYPEIEIKFIKEFDSCIEVRVIIYHIFKQGGHGIRQSIEIQDCVRDMDEFISLIRSAISRVTE